MNELMKAYTQYEKEKELRKETDPPKFLIFDYIGGYPGGKKNVMSVEEFNKIIEEMKEYAKQYEDSDNIRKVLIVDSIPAELRTEETLAPPSPVDQLRLYASMRSPEIPRVSLKLLKSRNGDEKFDFTIHKEFPSINDISDELEDVAALLNIDPKFLERVGKL